MRSGGCSPPFLSTGMAFILIQHLDQLRLQIAIRLCALLAPRFLGRGFQALEAAVAELTDSAAQPVEKIPRRRSEVVPSLAQRAATFPHF